MNDRLDPRIRAAVAELALAAPDPPDLSEGPQVRDEPAEWSRDALGVFGFVAASVTGIGVWLVGWRWGILTVLVAVPLAARLTSWIVAVGKREHRLDTLPAVGLSQNRAHRHPLGKPNVLTRFTPRFQRSVFAAFGAALIAVAATGALQPPFSASEMIMPATVPAAPASVTTQPTPTDSINEACSGVDSVKIGGDSQSDQAAFLVDLDTRLNHLRSSIENSGLAGSSSAIDAVIEVQRSVRAGLQDPQAISTAPSIRSALSELSERLTELGATGCSSLSALLPE